MPRKLTKDEQAARDAHFEEHGNSCWSCRFFGRQPGGRFELHHIAGKKAKDCEQRANYCALCSRCHATLQSDRDAELICLVFKAIYDGAHYSPSRICSLRGRAESCWTTGDVERTQSTMYTTERLIKCQ